MNSSSIIRIGTRKSLLAMTQAGLVRELILQHTPGVQIDLVPMLTTGDSRTDRPLADIGGKGLFTKELEEGLLSGSIDMAVHSLKDMETHLRPGMVIAAVCERADARDAFIASDGKKFAELPKNARIGTSSVRRTAQIKHLRPDIEIIAFRGNVPTRLAKLAGGEADATILAVAGLKRIDKAEVITEILDVKTFIPAAGQGVIAMECAEKNHTLRDLLAAINHAPTFSAIIAERAALTILDGSCRTPIGAYASIHGDVLSIEGMLAEPDGSLQVTASCSGAVSDAKRLGEELARKLLQLKR